MLIINYQKSTIFVAISIENGHKKAFCISHLNGQHPRQCILVSTTIFMPAIIFKLNRLLELKTDLIWPTISTYTSPPKHWLQRSLETIKGLRQQIQGCHRPVVFKKITQAHWFYILCHKQIFNEKNKIWEIKSGLHFSFNLLPNLPWQGVWQEIMQENMK